MEQHAMWYIEYDCHFPNLPTHDPFFEMDAIAELGLSMEVNVCLSVCILGAC